MKAGEWKIEDGGWQTRSAPLLSDASGIGETFRRRFALPGRSNNWRNMVAALAFLAATATVRAQSYSIDWYKIAGGGGASTNGQYAITGTIGQPDAGGAMSGGSYGVTGGFWSLISVVQTGGLPNLTITQSGNSVIVSWLGAGNYTLQQNANLALNNGWATSGYTVTTANGTNSITITPPSGNLFFRLKQ